jgi:hypothetical protein
MMKPFSIGSAVFMAMALSASASAASPDDVDTRLQAMAAKINAQQPGDASGRITSAVAGAHSITLNFRMNGDKPLESDEQGQREVRHMVCGTPAFRAIVDRYGVTFHLVISASNWPMPLNANVKPADCNSSASTAASSAPSATPLPRRGATPSNWQYTHWGMTPSEVIAASKGAAHLGTGVQSVLDEASADVVGTYETGGRIFSTTFNFKEGHLASVALLTTNWSQCIPTLKDLQAVYGNPEDLTDGKVVANAVWRDRGRNNFIKMRLLAPKFCEVVYSPIASAAAFGL